MDREIDTVSVYVISNSAFYVYPVSNSFVDQFLGDVLPSP